VLERVRRIAMRQIEGTIINSRGALMQIEETMSQVL
jgi:hypothetical protein